MFKASPKESLMAYGNLMKKHQVPADVINKRLCFLGKIVELIDDDQEVDGHEYRHCVEIITQRENIQIENSDYLLATREFFFLLTGEFKKAAAILSQKENIVEIDFTYQNFQEWFEKAEKTNPSEREIKIIQQYVELLSQTMHNPIMLRVHEKLATFFSVTTLRGVSKDSESYRKAADQILGLMMNNKQKNIFLSTIREFYKVWA